MAIAFFLGDFTMALFGCAVKTWMRRWDSLRLVALILALCLGCQKSFSAKVTVLDEEEKQDDNNKETDCNKSTGAKKGKNYVVMIETRLYANGKYYGEIASGSSVLLDKDGLVYVNGNQRNEIKPKTKRLLDELARIKKAGPKGDISW